MTAIIRKRAVPIPNFHTASALRALVIHFHRIAKARCQNQSMAPLAVELQDDGLLLVSVWQRPVNSRHPVNICRTGRGLMDLFQVVHDEAALERTVAGGQRALDGLEKAGLQMSVVLPHTLGLEGAAVGRMLARQLQVLDGLLGKEEPGPRARKGHSLTLG